jgi:predicted Zn-dependent peptidase
MNSLNITASKVEQFKERIIQEIRSRNKADPYLASSNYFNSLLYPDFAYHHPPRGLESDIRNITFDDMIRFYSTYYKPNNAVLCISGYFNRSRTQALIQKYFGTIPMGRNIPPPPRSAPVEKENIVKTIENPLASLPGFYIGYRIARPLSPDYYPLKIIEYILLRGHSSRLYKKLLKKTRMIAQSLDGGIEIRNDQAVFKIFVTCNNEAMVKLSKREVYSEINKLKSSLISREELLKAKNMFKMDFTNQYATSADKAIFLVEAEFAGIELNEIQAELEKYLSVTASDISGILNRYFSDDHIVLDINIK